MHGDGSRHDVSWYQIFHHIASFLKPKVVSSPTGIVSFTKGKRASVANGPFWASIDWKRYKNSLVNSTLRFLIQNGQWRSLDMCELIIFSNFSISIASWTEPVLLIWYKRASVFCFESTPSKAHLFNFWISCGFMIHWRHFEGFSWLTSARSASILWSSHHFSMKC